MFRILGFSFFCTVVTVAALNAGQIQIGGASGLTAAYVGVQPAAVQERAYAATLFVGDTENGATPTDPSVSLTDPNNGVTFAILNENNNNYWAINSTNSTPVTMTVPVGIFGITNVWTMLNEYWGVAGVQNTTVTLNFGNSAAGIVTGTQIFNFVNGTEIRDATDCTGPSTSPAPSGGSSFPTPCTTFARTTTAASQAFTTPYNGNIVAGTQALNTSGNLVLDDQALLVNPLYYNKYLVNIQVTNVNGGIQVSRTALSGITVSTPEPASVAMFLGGFAAMMLFYSRRRRNASVDSRS